jgi:phosphocarrier protein HPr
MNNKYTQEILIINKLGLHARASAKLTQLAGRFKSQIFISKNSRRVNAKSIMGVMMLAAGMGTLIKLDVEGEDAEQAFDEIKQLFNDKFGESE